MAIKQRRRRRQADRRNYGRWLPQLVIVLAVALTGYVVYLDFKITAQFEGKRWALPARVYARPLELYPGVKLTPVQLVEELDDLKYHQTPQPSTPASFSISRDEFHLITRAFTFWDRPEPSHDLRVHFVDDIVTEIVDNASGNSLPIVRLDPVLIGGIYPSHNEDRVLVKLEDVPPLLTQGLIVIEDRAFYHHIGIDPRAVSRAMFANLKAGGIVQGGSTLTQQLIKNYFLTNEQTLWRKFNEAIMALLLEWHYDKDEILEAYLNEVYLGQDAHRAIHGFGLASRFYFEKPVDKLELPQIALLVAIVKGPSYYDPRRHPDRALERRNLVLEVMAQQHIITDAQRLSASLAPLSVTPRARSGITTYPAFLDLVRRELRRDYREQDLTSEGLQVFTTLDPRIQRTVEKIVTERVAQLERRHGFEPKTLEAAAVVATAEDGEILAVTGGRDPRYAGFNRALDAMRQVGSLIKPAVYLTALQRSKQYTLATVLNDEPLSVEMPDGKIWSPKNYDETFRGPVLMHTALANSYNVPTARLGLAIGVDNVIATLGKLGIQRDVQPYPSLLLGAIALSPLDVAQMYQTFAARGFSTPLRAVRAVMLPDGQPVKRYALTVEEAFAPETIYLVNTVLNEVVREGTGAALRGLLPADLVVAGKTGTTDDYRDSWFAGFAENLLGVVWVGNDDNRSIGLTGSSGALPVWGDMMRNIDARPFDLSLPANVELVRIDSDSGLRATSGCEHIVELPFINGSAPEDYAPCAGGEVRRSVDKTINWFKDILD